MCCQASFLCGAPLEARNPATCCGGCCCCCCCCCMPCLACFPFLPYLISLLAKQDQFWWTLHFLALEIFPCHNAVACLLVAYLSCCLCLCFSLGIGPLTRSPCSRLGSADVCIYCIYCVYIYIYVYGIYGIYIYVNVYIYIFVSIFVYIYIHTHIYIYAYIVLIRINVNLTERANLYNSCIS